jgi:hypothetical protein
MVIKLAEALLGHSSTLWMENYNFLELACFLKPKERESTGTLCVNRNNVPPLVRAKNIEKE